MQAQQLLTMAAIRDTRCSQLAVKPAPNQVLQWKTSKKDHCYSAKGQILQKVHILPEIHFADHLPAQSAAESAVSCGSPCQAAAGAVPRASPQELWVTQQRGFPPCTDTKCGISICFPQPTSKKLSLSLPSCLVICF